MILISIILNDFDHPKLKKW